MIIFIKTHDLKTWNSTTFTNTIHYGGGTICIGYVIFKNLRIVLLNVDLVVRNEDYLKKCDYNFQYDLSSECLSSAIKIKHV